MPKLREIFEPDWRTLGGSSSWTLDAWLKNELSRADAVQIILSDENVTAHSKIHRAKLVARNLPIWFEQFAELNASFQRKLCMLFHEGIADYRSSRDAARAALQHRDRWPQGAAGFIWAGVLRSALDGHTTSPEVFWDDFLEWQLTAKDINCRNIVHRFGLAIETNGKSLG